MRNAAPKLLRVGVAFFFFFSELSTDERYGIDSFANSVLLFNHITRGSAYKTHRSKSSWPSAASVFRIRGHPLVIQPGLLGSEIYLEMSAARSKQPRTLATLYHCATTIGLARLSPSPQMPSTPSAELESGENWKATALMWQRGGKQGSSGGCCFGVTGLGPPELEVQGPSRRQNCSCLFLWWGFN